jgi:hypothetical protein
MATFAAAELLIVPCSVPPAIEMLVPAVLRVEPAPIVRAEVMVNEPPPVSASVPPV